ncbi:MAG TPA: rod shape-determining protein MreC [Burkholderiaceae bacterium]|nr:rod shape-determining protein MreC [Burkholderiaceae bacterium]
MEYSPPPFFKQGPSARVRLVLFSLLAVGLLLADARYATLGRVREVVATGLYPVQRIALLPRDVVMGVYTFFSDQTTLREENERLRNARLVDAQTLQQAAHLAAENAQLRRLLDAKERVGAPATFAQVLYDARDPFSRKVVIDRGSQHGLRPGYPAIDERGVLGQVVRTFPFTSEVALVTDRDLSIPVQVLRNGLRAVAYGGQAPNSIEVRYLAANADIQPGDRLVTSGIDGVYPPGLAVATVATVDRTAANQFAKVICAPTAGVARASQLLVVRYETGAPPPPPPSPGESTAPVKGKKGAAPR